MSDTGASVTDRRAIDPMLIQQIENNVLLKQVVQNVKEVSDKQDLNHLVAIQLRDHSTIERVDALWAGFGSFKFLLRFIAAMLGAIPLTVGVLTLTHYAFNWPLPGK